MMMDVDSVEWLNPDRLQSLQKQLNPCIKLLLYSGCLDKILAMWIRSEVIESFRESNPSESKDKAEIDVLKLWCHKRWGSRLNQLFLEKKDQLDLVSFRLLTIENQAVALEVYHRLKEKESSFDYLANSFGMGSNKDKDTLRKNKRMGSLPIELQKKIRTMKPGDLCKPLSSGQSFLIIQIEEFADAKFTDSIKDKLLMDQFSSWASSIVKATRDHLNLSNA